MKAMINYRLSVARDFEKSPSLFSLGGFVAIYIATGGYPRKVVFLCHQVILKMIIREKKKAGWFLVRNCRSEMKSPLYRKLGWILAGLLLIIIVGVSFSAIKLHGINLNANKKLKVIFANLDIPEVENNKIHNVKMPDYIGKVSMTKRRTIWWTLNNIYGDTGTQIMGGIFKVNPFLKNKDKVMIGTTITLPSIPADSKPLKQGDIVVALESGQDLEKMYNIFRNNPDEPKLPRLAFLSFWNKKKGLEFVVVIDKKFRDIKSAEGATGKLPPEIAAKAKIVSQWDADTVFFNRRALRD
jgi:general secretion pathway protein A